MEADVVVCSGGDTIGVVVVCSGGDTIGVVVVCSGEYTIGVVVVCSGGDIICGECESIEDAPGE